MTVREKVVAEFEATGAEKYSSALGMVGKLGGGLGSALSSALGAVNPLNVALGALTSGAALMGVAAIGSEFENVRNRMAGTLNALGEANGFPDAMERAAGTIQQIETAAAALPGEASDYVEIFTTALPYVQSAVGGTLTQMTEFTNKYAAVASSLQVDSQQAAMDLTRMLAEGRGMAGADVRTFQTMLPYMKQIEGYSGLTAESFNKMDQQARANLLGKAVESMGPMLDAASNSWDAITGSLATTGKLLVRTATGGLFEAMKSSLSSINSLFVDNNGQLTAFGAKITEVGAAIGSTIGGAMSWVVELMGQAVTGMSELSGGGGGGVMGALRAVFDTLTSAATALATLFDPVVSLMSTFGSIVGDLVVSVLPPLLSGLNAVLQPVIALTGAVIGIADSLLTTLAPTLHSLWEAVGRAVEAAGQFLANILRPLGLGLLDIALFLYNAFEPAIKGVGEALTWLIDGIAGLLSWLAEATDGLVNAMAEGTEVTEDQPEWYRDAREALLGLGNAADAAAASTNAATVAAGGEPAAGGARAPRAATPARRGGGKTVQDFRHSRFTIQQKFEEGFDPDRIAVAFASDLGRVSEQRLQSGYEPEYAVR